MSENLSIQLNGSPRVLASTADPSMLPVVLTALDLKLDRIAVELNGAIVRRADWPNTLVKSSDRLEVVHFVGGGLRLL